MLAGVFGRLTVREQTRRGTRCPFLKNDLQLFKGKCANPVTYLAVNNDGRNFSLIVRFEKVTGII